MNYWLLLIPVLSSFIGWFVIRLAVSGLFHPRLPGKLFGMRFQGIIPRHREQLAKEAGRFVQKEFSFSEGIAESISNPQHFETVKPMIEEHIDDFLRNKLKEQMPMIGMFIGDKTIDTLKVIFIKEIETLFPQVIGRFAINLGQGINIEEIVTEKIAAIPDSRLQEMLQQGLRKPFNKAAIIGALVGFVIGLLQLAIVLLTA